MTTPESLEVMLLSPRVPHVRLFRDVRALIVDEVHALAGTDRGAHLMCGVRAARTSYAGTMSNVSASVPPLAILLPCSPGCKGPHAVKVV